MNLNFKGIKMKKKFKGVSDEVMVTEGTGTESIVESNLYTVESARSQLSLKINPTRQSRFFPSLFK